MNRRNFIIGMAALVPGSALAAKKKAPAYRGAEVVEFVTPERRGTVIVNTEEKALYHIIGRETAIRYGVAVGKDGFDWAGIAMVGRKVEWPTWTPPASMIRRRPDLEKWRNGMPGGRENPLGARAIYLYRGGRDTMFRIHGTTDAASVGHATSAGCIRLFNQDAIDLYNKVPNGTRVKVRTEAESLALEGPQMLNAYGHMVPETPENVTKREKDEAMLAKQEAKNKAAAEKAEKKRLAACARRGIPDNECAPPEGVATLTVGTSDAG